MELKLDKNLLHQQIPVDNIAKVFCDVSMELEYDIHSNPVINLSDTHLEDNIQKIQEKLNPAERGCMIGNPLTLDIKMETGTGKTYVYTKTMFELHKLYGINKFVIIVPSLSIKAGTLQFLQEKYAKQHFFSACDYRCELEVCALNAAKNKNGKKFFPAAVYNFAAGTRQDKNKIFVLVTNMQLCTGNSQLLKSDYDSCVNDFSRPFDAIASTHPFIIIDEPHRFDRTKTTYSTLVDRLKPQCIIRFGATFPEKNIGRGSSRRVVKDYENLLYNLDACEAFNQNLVKGVAKENFNAPSNKKEKIKVLRINNKESVDFQFIKQEAGTTKKKRFSLNQGDALSIISKDLSGITIDGITSSTVELSNGISKSTGEEIDVDAYMTSYQKEMIRLALQRHFEIERENFNRNASRIKTLALFFIDDIPSYRQIDGSDKKLYLREMFEELLLEAINKQLAKLSSDEIEYKEFLLASKNNISLCHAGYFSHDNSDTDENVAAEVNIILHGKKELLSFKDENGNWNILRFLFSKWTLKEGWDNPNVFTIAKLRSSGSETSKIQEVGRGLRLPVDEHGNRIANEDFTLNYIVDFTEADFAEKLVAEINQDVHEAVKLTAEKIKEVAGKRNITADDLVIQLMSKHFINLDYEINQQNVQEFYAEYPEFVAGVNRNKVIDRNTGKEKKTKIRASDFNKLQELWNKVNQRYMLYYDADLDADIEKETYDIFNDKEIFTSVYLTSKREATIAAGNRVGTETLTGVSYIIDKRIPYSEFLKRINKATNIPIKVVHKALCKIAEEGYEVKPEFINEFTVQNFINKFNGWRTGHLQGRFHYMKENFVVKETALTDKYGHPKKDIVLGRIGQFIEKGTPSDKYLYDIISFDSPLERENILTDIDSVDVYGKIPTRSIKIPTVVGETYSPDFMYVVKHTNGEQEINIIVESKKVPDDTDLRDKEEMKIECAKVFFKQLQEDGYNVKFSKQLQTKKIASIIDEMMR